VPGTLVVTGTVVVPGSVVDPWVDVVISGVVVVSTGKVVVPGPVVKSPHLPKDQQQYQALLLCL
jgi:hypothetical protein